VREVGRSSGAVWQKWQVGREWQGWRQRAAGACAAVAALSLLVESSCRLGGTYLPPLGAEPGHVVSVAGLPGVAAAPEAAAELDALTSAAESALPDAVAAVDSSSASQPADVAAETPAEQAAAASPAAPASPAAAAGWHAPDVARRPFDFEIEQWRPLVRQELARAFSEGRLAGGASKLDDDVVLALIEQESSGDPDAESWAGAMGLTQVMPFTFADMIYGDERVVDSLDPATILDPHQNVRAGIRYLAMAMQIFRGNIYWALSSYNAGIGAVQDWRAVDLQSVPPIGGYVETANYAPSILVNLAAHRPGLVVNIPPPMTDDQVADAVDRLQSAGLW
jgi:soluble lytic murein transglycosylase-like protein